MEPSKNNEKNVESIKKLQDEVDCLSKQTEQLKKELDVINPTDDLNIIVNRIDKIEERINCLDEKITGIGDCKTYINEVSKQNGDLKKTIQGERVVKRLNIIFLILGLAFFVFAGACVWELWSLIVIKTTPFESISLIFGGILVLLMMAIMLWLFVNKTKVFLIQKRDSEDNK